MQTQITTLSNGLRIVTSTRPEIQTTSLGIWVNTGAAYEQKEENGISKTAYTIYWNTWFLKARQAAHLFK